jgi:hypothetical protein
MIVAPPSLTLADLGDIVVAADDEAYATQIALQQTAHLQSAGESEARWPCQFPPRTSPPAASVIKMTFDAPTAAPIGLTVVANNVVDSGRRADGSAHGVGGDVYSIPIRKAARLFVVDWSADRLIATSGAAAGDRSSIIGRHGVN